MYQVMSGCGRDPIQEQFSDTWSPSDTPTTGGSGLITGPEGIAGKETISF